MAPAQKAAWFNLLVFGGTVLLFLVAVPVLAIIAGRTWSEAAWPATGIFGLLGLSGLSSVFFRKKKGAAGPTMDERDQILVQKAWGAGMAIFWVIFVAVCMGAWASLRYFWNIERVNLPVEIFPWMVGGAFIISMLAQSIATLHFYGWRWSDEDAR